MALCQLGMLVGVHPRAWGADCLVVKELGLLIGSSPRVGEQTVVTPSR